MEENREEWEQSYFKLAKDLEKKYPNHSFYNHCFWRMALDKTVGDKWDRRLKRPAYKHLSDKQLERVVFLLKSYLIDEKLMLEHNDFSLKVRGKK